MKKQNSVLRLTAKIYSSPQLITEDGFRVVQKYLEDRNNEILLYEDDDSSEPAQPEAFYDAKEKIGVLDIWGTLTHKPVYGLCGATGVSYQSLVQKSEEMMAAGVKTILMNVSSGGGEAYAAFESANAVRKMADENGVKLYGYVDGMAASAAYAWICICDEVYAHPDAETGSIGVVCALLDTSGYMEKEGLKRVFVTGGKEKVPFNADGSFKQEFLDNLQYKVDVMYENFISHVSQHTGLSPEAIKATEAKTFLSKDALSLGLIDGIKTEKDFQAYVVSQHKGRMNEIS